MKSRFLVIWIALAIGCRDQGISRLDEVRAAVCACKTAECADAAMKRVASTQVRPGARSKKIARDMLDCLAKLYEKTRPTTGPDETMPAAAEPAAPSTPAKSPTAATTPAAPR